MESSAAEFELAGSVIVFFDTLYDGKPCVFRNPRNHESLFFVTEGELLYEKDGARDVVGLGQTGYIARGSRDVSSAYGSEKVSYIAFNFNFEPTSPGVPLPPGLPFGTLCRSQPGHDMGELFRAALASFLSRTPGSELVYRGLLLQIIGRLYAARESAPDGGRRSSSLSAAVGYIGANCGDSSLRISDAAAACGMTDRSFRRLFAEKYSETPSEYLLRARVDKAKAMLLCTTRSVGDIARQCGFSDIYSFSHSFKRRTGKPPSAYRLGE